jgi:hypothetical protein
VSDDKSPLEQAIDQAMDAFVYAPLGLLFDGPELFPQLAEKGRNQVKVARMMGQMAVQMGQTEAEKRMARTQGPVRDALTALGVVAPAAPPTVDTPPTKPAPTKKTPAKKVAAEKAPGPAANRSAAPDTLGIPDYDSLSASQVVKRLHGMGTSELDAVRSYEAATRARKTILNRISQLQKD